MENSIGRKYNPGIETDFPCMFYEDVTKNLQQGLKAEKIKYK
jgi:hypothetical protein